MEDNTDKFEEMVEKMLNDPNKDNYTKIELLKAFSESVHSLIEDWVLMRQALKAKIEKLEREIESEESE